MKITIIGMDPSTSHFGMCKATVDIHTLEIQVVDLILTNTESESKKGVIKQSDDLRRAHEVRTGMLNVCAGAALAVSEIPFCNPGGYASANFNSGLVTGVLASCPIPLIQVFPADVKIAAVGHRHAAKEEMIEWAIAKHPDAPWLMRKLKGKMYPIAKNEHLADALAAVYAGVRTKQFEQVMALYKGIREAA